MDVTFGDANKLYALWGLVPLILVLLHARNRRARAAATLLDAPMRARLMPSRRGWRAALPATLLVVGVACLVVAAARPRFGTVYEKVAQRGADLVVILDVSKSMLSRDVHPSRLERSKAYIRDLLARVGGHRAGLVVFAGRPVVACPMTADLAFFESVLTDVTPDSAPRGGTVIGDAIRAAIDVLNPIPDRDQAFVLITDGEDQDSFPLEAAAVAAERGVRIFTVGIGDPNVGARIPIDGEPAGASRRYVTHDGKEVLSRMDEGLLQAVARETRGAYVPARTGTYDLGDVYVDHLASLRAGALREEERRRHREQFQLFAGLGLLALLASWLIRPTHSRRAVAAAAAAVLLLGSATPAFASDERVTGVETLNRAVDRLERGEVDAAVLLFDEADALLPDQPLVKFGRGVAEQARGELDVAETNYSAAAHGGDALATAWARYNLGTVEVEHAKVAFGGPPEDAVGEAREAGTTGIERAIAEFRAALRVDPTFDDARYNLELLRVWLKHIRDVWARKDAEKQDQEQPDQPPDPVKLLEGLLDDQLGLDDELREHPDTSVDLAPRQAELAPRATEVEELVRGMVEQSAAQMTESLSAQGQLGPNGELPAEAEAQLRAVYDALVQPLADSVGAIGRASEALAAGDSDAARVDQDAARSAFATVWSGLADVPKALERAISVEDQVIERTDEHLAAGAAASPAAVGTRVRQEFVAVAATVLAAKAEGTLRQVEQALAQPVPDELDDAARQQMDQQRAQAEALVPMLEKAVENGPKIPPLVTEAAGHLDAARYAEARTTEEEIRRLLEEIRELQPPEEQDPEQQPDESQDENDQKDEQDEQDDEQQDQEEDQEQQDQEKQDQEKDDDPSDEKDPQEQDPKDDENEPDEPPDDGSEPKPSDPEKRSPQQVMQLLQKALDREKELKEKEKALERLLAVPVPVEKDW